MIRKITYVESMTTSPYKNLAMEEYLLFHCAEDECILYLWQNEKTVVIGKNQNAWKECYVSRLEEDGGHLVRRLSGGGAVFHDLGNLNFTFLTRSNHYDVKKQTQIIVDALKKIGICATSSGRNDILVDGKKVSGNAYFKQGDFCYQHGTLMIDVDVNQLSKYLNVPKDKLESKGIKSVRSRVGNLKDYLPEITVSLVKEKLLESFEETFGIKAEYKSGDHLDKKEMEDYETKYASWEWRCGRKMEFQYELSHRFDWGNISILLQVDSGKIVDVDVYSDAMYIEIFSEIKKYLKGIPYSKKSICAELSLCWSVNKEEEKLLGDIVAWIENVDL